MSTTLAAVGRRDTTLALLALAAALLLVGLGLQEGVRWMAGIWFSAEEYSHGVLVPFIAAFLAWQRLPLLRSIRWEPSWTGVAVVAFGLLMGGLGVLATVFFLQQYALLVVLVGLVLALGGWRVLARLKAPLLVLVLMVPLPNFFSNNLSLQLQLLSSKLGVLLIRLFGISVYLEGNVIDLGAYKLQVAEACSGLRYLLPLLTLAVVISCFYRAAAWKRVLLVFSAIPLTLFMNSLRIGLIGLLVEHWGISLAEGLVHEVQGWLMFMLCALLLVGFAWALARIGGDRRPWREVLDLSAPAAAPAPVNGGGPRPWPAPFLVAVIIAAAAGAALLLAPARAEAVPVRHSFVEFPMQLGAWQGRRSALEGSTLDTLQLDDYVIADYSGGPSPPLNFYVAWYASQRSGQSAHSPRSCLPGGGWEITEFGQRSLGEVLVRGEPLRVNRALIVQGDQRALVYYWFKQRDRDVTSEYAVKWWLFRDAIGRNRTDGALVRIVRPLAPGEDVARGDADIVRFAGLAVPLLPGFVPD